MVLIQEYLLPDEILSIKSKLPKGTTIDKFYEFVNNSFKKRKNECLGYDLMRLARAVKLDSPAYNFLKCFLFNGTVDKILYDNYFSHLKKHIDWGKYTICDIRYNLSLINMADEKNIPILYTIKPPKDDIYYCVLISRRPNTSVFMIDINDIIFSNIFNNFAKFSNELVKYLKKIK